MAARFPTNLVTVTQLPDTRSDSTTAPTNHANDHNQIADELIAIEAELGLLPKGTYTDVKSRLDIVQAGASELHGLMEQLRTNGATQPPIAWNMDGALCSSGNTITMTNQRLIGFAFQVPKTLTATGIQVFCDTIGVTFTAYNGGGLFSIDASGNLTFIADTGADALGRAFFNSTGVNKVAFTSTQVLSPGTLYCAAVINNATTPAVMRGLNGAPNMTIGAAPYFRCGGIPAAGVTEGTVMTNWGFANVNLFTAMPYIAVY